MVNHGGQSDAPNLLEHMVEAELTPELRTQFTQLAENWLDADKQSRMTVELGGRINEAYHHTIADIAKLHEGKNYSEDFGKEAYKVAKRLFENDRTDYIHDHKQAKQIVTKFMLNILHEMDTVTAHAIAHAYEHADGSMTDEDRFEYLKGAFQNELGIGGREDDEDKISIDGLIGTITANHRAKQFLMDAASKLKNNYGSVVASKKLAGTVTPERKKAYREFVEGLVAENHLSVNHGKTAFHDTPQWLAIHRELYNHKTYEAPYRNIERLGIQHGAAHGGH